VRRRPRANGTARGRRLTERGASPTPSPHGLECPGQAPRNPRLPLSPPDPPYPPTPPSASFPPRPPRPSRDLRRRSAPYPCPDLAVRWVGSLDLPIIVLPQPPCGNSLCPGGASRSTEMFRNYTT
jgi:hypothetical protein